MSGRPSAGLRLELARAVAPERSQPRGLQIDASNQGRRFEPLEDLVAVDAVFAVEVDAAVVALDADSRELGSLVDALAHQLQEQGRPCVLVASGRDGHRHLFVRTRSITERSELVAWARRCGVDVRQGSALIRPPGTRHRNDAPVELLAPSSWDEALHALRRVEAHKRLPSRLWRLIRFGDQQGRYRRADGTKDPSTVVQVICNMAVANHIAPARIHALLSQPWAVGGSSLRRRQARSPELASKWFDHTWRRAQDWAGKPAFSGRAEALGELEEAFEAFNHAPHPGQTGNTDTSVFCAAYNLAKDQGGPTAAMSVRQLALGSGRATGTVVKSLRRLRKAGWLELVEEGHHDTAHVYRISVPHSARKTATASPPSGGVGCVPILRDPGLDAFSAGALGPGGWRVLNALDDHDGHSTHEIAEALSLHPGTVRRHLARLSANGLVWCDGGRWYRAADAPEATGEGRLEESLELVAKGYRVSGRRARRGVEFDRQRQQWRTLLLLQLPDAQSRWAIAQRDDGARRLPWHFGYPAKRAA